MITTLEVESFFVELWYGTALALRRDEALERGQLRAWLRAWLLLEPCDTPYRNLCAAVALEIAGGK